MRNKKQIGKDLGGVIEDNCVQNYRRVNNEYPYIVIRYYATVYRNKPVEFVKNEIVASNPKAIQIVNPEPYISGELTQQARDSVIGVSLYIVKSKGFRACVVFSEDDCVYCEADGSTKQSSNPPTGNLNFEKLDFESKSDRD